MKISHGKGRTGAAFLIQQEDEQGRWGTAESEKDTALTGKDIAQRSPAEKKRRKLGEKKRRPGTFLSP